jgi:hypothetical protein
MKKYALLAGISFFALLIVLPVTCSVNHAAYNPALSLQTLQADGAPLPAPIPHTAISSSTLTADGAPLPAPIPHTTINGAPSSSTLTLIADGAPLPAPIPHGNGSTNATA